MPLCPICGVEVMTIARHLGTVTVCVCTRCDTSINVPDHAWEHMWRRVRPDLSGT
jgi:hypothetical protein